MKKRTFAILLLAAGAISYASGIRLITLAEVPSSHRPWQPFLTADYASQHLSQATNIFGE